MKREINLVSRFGRREARKAQARALMSIGMALALAADEEDETLDERAGVATRPERFTPGGAQLAADGRRMGGGSMRG